MQFKQAEKEAGHNLLAKQQALEIEAQRAARENEMGLLELEKQKFELEKQKLELEKERVALQRAQLELENTRMNYAIEAANKIIDRLAPGIDQATWAMIVPTLLKNLLQFQNGGDIEVILPPVQITEEKTTTSEDSEESE